MTSPGAKMKGKLSNPNFILEEVPEAERSQNAISSADEDDDDLDDVDDIPFTKKMRMETRKIHNISDTLVNAKLGLAMSDDRVWAEGLLIFYEIFRFLEESMIRLSPKNEPFQRMHKIISGIERTPAFESDIGFYYGQDFLKNYEIRPSVADYLRHLQTLEQREPLRLLAYIYHLYMGLLSGGQILKRKRDLRNRLKDKAWSIFSWFGLSSKPSSVENSSPVASGSNKSLTKKNKGDAVTAFEDGRSIADIKKEIAFTMDDIASDLSKDEKNSLLEESQQVFKRNNEIVGSIKHTGMTALKNYATCFVFVILMGATLYYFLADYLVAGDEIVEQLDPTMPFDSSPVI